MTAITAWATVTVDAIDMTAAARTLVDELGHERASELADILLALTDDDDDLDDDDDDLEYDPTPFLCLDCRVDTNEIGQYPYRCPDEMWLAVVPGGRGMLCLDCLARRLDAAGLTWPWLTKEVANLKIVRNDTGPVGQSSR